MKTTIYLETLLTDKVLEGLESENTPYYIIRYGERHCMSAGAIYRAKNASPESITHILLPIKLTTDMLQKEAEKRWAGKLGTNKEERDCIYMGFCECFYWLLNLNKEGEK